LYILGTFIYPIVYTSALEEEIVYSEETTGGHSMSETNSQNKRILTLSLIGISVAALIGVIVIIKNRK